MAQSKYSLRVPRPKEALIVAALKRAAHPLSAYDLIDLLHDEGVTSPPTVYRVLKRLMERGHVHRIETLNAFVWCAHEGHSCSAAFAICDTCGVVTEFHQERVLTLLAEWADASRFSIDKTTLELRGRCRNCAAPSPVGQP